MNPRILVTVSRYNLAVGAGLNCVDPYVQED